ncbi:hypothetical protein L1987_85437 [Smallanthus sonchifolius]|uniref:Uncharacterized protein n=1 Tax=Smallanthus sonchifolius TaxID=185202 RepID=A0ACB8XWR2_9ASTR|nr:hypothetical protein L1987_85437 [Smallanthus sonchifolius]
MVNMHIDEFMMACPNASFDAVIDEYLNIDVAGQHNYDVSDLNVGFSIVKSDSAYMTNRNSLLSLLSNVELISFDDSLLHAN